MMILYGTPKERMTYIRSPDKVNCDFSDYHTTDTGPH
jgi:hypothetical protein